MVNPVMKFLSDIGFAIEDCYEDYQEDVKAFNEEFDKCNGDNKQQFKLFPKGQKVIKKFYDYHEITIEEIPDEETAEKLDVTEGYKLSESDIVDTDFMEKVMAARRRKDIKLKIKS